MRNALHVTPLSKPVQYTLWILQVWLPRVVQALQSALADIKLYCLIQSLEHSDVAKWILKTTWTTLFLITFSLIPILGNVGWNHVTKPFSLFVTSTSASSVLGSHGTAAPGPWPTPWRPHSQLWLSITILCLALKHTAGWTYTTYTSTQLKHKTISLPVHL